MLLIYYELQPTVEIFYCSVHLKGSDSDSDGKFTVISSQVQESDTENKKQKKKNINSFLTKFLHARSVHEEKRPFQCDICKAEDN